ncbi:MAG TPA: conjugal transfer protein TraI [Sphingobacteriaceae bacterium]
MKKLTILMPGSLILLLVSLSGGKAYGQTPITEIIKQGVKKVITAVDLKIQRMQNETIWLQNAQKVLENQLSKLKLAEIAAWTEKQRDLYAKYYTDLWKVKAAISYYQRIREMMNHQALLVEEYKRGWGLARQDQNFTPEELNYMYRVYSGILDESVKNLDQILLVVNSFKTQMSDAARLKLIEESARRMEQNYADLHQFNRQNILLSFSRAKSSDQILRLQQLYGIQSTQE